MMPSIEILNPASLSETLKILSYENGNIKIIAGGTDILTGLKQGSKRFAGTEMLVDINSVPELKGIEVSDGKISIGAAETFSTVYKNPLIAQHLPLLTKAAGTVGSLQIRNRATIAGNFTNNAPCADAVPVLLVYDAGLEIESWGAKRKVALSEFLQEPYKTQLRKNEIVTRINIPLPPDKLNGDFYKLGRRRAVAVSRITLAVLIGLNGTVIDEIRIASGAVTPIGMRFKEIEKFAEGKEVSDKLLKTIAVELGEEVIKVTGLRWSSAYKLPVMQQMMYQLLHSVVSLKSEITK